jgi:hypothetical protein
VQATASGTTHGLVAAQVTQITAGLNPVFFVMNMERVR